MLLIFYLAGNYGILNKSLTSQETQDINEEKLSITHQQINDEPRHARLSNFKENKCF
jgi:hypothetical protein